MPIVKSAGVTNTERLLSDLCDRTFLRLWSYPNPFKDDGKELCDLLAVFENHAFVFFDRESRRFDHPEGELPTSWNRWKKEVIDKQIATAKGAERYLRSGRKIYLDDGQQVEFPINLGPDSQIHKIVVAHGAKEACEAFSPDNISGSLAVSYGIPADNMPFPFMVALNRAEKIHVLDSHNLEIIFGELDTFADFTAYLAEKERAIEKYQLLSYAGEEDLLAHYFFNYDEINQRYQIGTKDESINAILIGEGEWQGFLEMPQYAERKEANANSYLWDELIQRTCQNALDGTLQGNATLLEGKSAIHEMAKEPRVARRFLSANILRAINNFPENETPRLRNLSFMRSAREEKGYVFLQIKHPNTEDYDTEYRPKRQTMLEIACGAAKNKFPDLKKVVGIAIDAPKFHRKNSEDFILMVTEEWPEEQRHYYDNANKALNFFETNDLKQGSIHMVDFPVPREMRAGGKIGRNDPCPCGSGRKYKRCCL